MTSSIILQKLLDDTTHCLWDRGNEVLYDLCKTEPAHKDHAVIIAKVWLIGRSYATPIERHKYKPGDVKGDLVYENKVAPIIQCSPIDDWISSIGKTVALDTRNTLSTHKKVMDLFHKISGIENRSLASKYLHFHLPAHFYIYDSRAQTSISALSKLLNVRMPPLSPHEFDDTYAKFVYRAEAVTHSIYDRFQRKLSPRQLDNLLLAWQRQYSIPVQSSAL